MPVTTAAGVTSEVMLVDMPSLRVAAVAGPMASADDIHPIHKKFVEMMLLDAPRALSFEGVSAPSGGQVHTGALVYGDYSKPNAVMSAFKQCLFIEQGIIPATNTGPQTAFAAEVAADPAVTVENTIPGLYAVVTHSGDYSGLAALARSMVYQTFPAMKLAHSGGPIIEFYHPQGADGLPITEVAIPVTGLP